MPHQISSRWLPNEGGGGLEIRNYSQTHLVFLSVPLVSEFYVVGKKIANHNFLFSQVEITETTMAIIGADVDGIVS